MTSETETVFFLENLIFYHTLNISTTTLKVWSTETKGKILEFIQ